MACNNRLFIHTGVDNNNISMGCGSSRTWKKKEFTLGKMHLEEVKKNLVYELDVDELNSDKIFINLNTMNQEEDVKRCKFFLLYFLLNLVTQQ